ncbi:MAG TPA: hypothetical protein P5056_01005 [Candidatus Paceibacterota bacterium]|nr:hypothetical protein [Candidatus Paceibacterota bacterium]
MNTKTLINIKTDKTIKEKASKVAAELGMPLGTIINAFLRQFIMDKEIHISASYRPSPMLKTIIAEAEMDIAEGKGLSPVFSKAEDALKYLRS